MLTTLTSASHLNHLEILRILAAAPALILFWSAAFNDLLHRIIPNRMVAMVAGFGIIVRIASAFLLPMTALEFGYALLWTVLFGAFLIFSWQKRLIGGGDVKMWIAATLIIPASAVQQEYFLFGVFLCGGLLSLLYLGIWINALLRGGRRRIVSPAPHGAWLPYRLLQIERRRALRRIGIPYGAAIALSATVTLLFMPMVGPGWLPLP